MSKNTTGKWLLFIIAFIMSCLIWYMVITSDDPRINISLGNVEVELLNGEQLHEQGLAYYVEENEAVKVTVNIIQERGWLIKPSDIHLTVDLSQHTGTETEFLLPITAEVVNNQLLIGNNYKLEDNCVKIRTEKLVEKEIPVSIYTEGDPEDNCSIGEAVLEQETVKIQVPKSKESLVAAAVATVDISGRSADYEGDVELQFLDAQGKYIDCDSEQIFPKTDCIQVLIPIGVTKEVEIEKISGIGICQEGYRCTGIEADKESILVIGPEESLKSLETITIPAYKVNIQDQSESFDLTFDLEELLTEKVRVYDPDEAELKVSVTIEKLEQKTFSLSADQLELKNLPSALKAEINNEKISVVLEALPEELEALKKDQIQISVDLNGYKKGTHQVQVDVDLSDADGKYKVISSQKVIVNLSES